jgi:hypothetical protein
MRLRVRPRQHSEPLLAFKTGSRDIAPFQNTTYGCRSSWSSDIVLHAIRDACFKTSNPPRGDHCWPVAEGQVRCYLLHIGNKVLAFLDIGFYSDLHSCDSSGVTQIRPCRVTSKPAMLGLFLRFDEPRRALFKQQIWKKIEGSIWRFTADNHEAVLVGSR